MKKMKLGEYIKYLDRKGDDVDVFVDGIDSIAYCPTTKFTPEGKAYFKEALEKCYVDDYDDVVMWDNDETDDEDGVPACAHLAWELFASLAGYCSVDNFSKWFKE